MMSIDICPDYGDIVSELTNENEKLTAYIATLKGVIEILEDQQRETKNILIDKNLHIDSLYEEGYKMQQRIADLEYEHNVWLIGASNAAKNLEARIAELEKDLSNKEIEYTDLWDDALALQSRIAELEAESERFTVHSDIERQDDKWIPEVQDV